MSSVFVRSTPKYENLKVIREEYLDLVEDGFRYNRKTEWEIISDKQLKREINLGLSQSVFISRDWWE